MKLCCNLLLAAALCVGSAYSLRCYSCPSPTVSGQCTAIANCSDSQPVCTTMVYSGSVSFPFDGDELVVKGCTAVCKPTDVNWLGIDRPIFCCNMDLCNKAGIPDVATSVKVNYVTSAITLIITVTVLVRAGL